VRGCLLLATSYPLPLDVVRRQLRCEVFRAVDFSSESLGFYLGGELMQMKESIAVLVRSECSRLSEKENDDAAS
jgi:hypothetical protein